MNNMRAFDAAQRVYDNMTPPDDGPCECPLCEGSGRFKMQGQADEMLCHGCEGYGLVDDEGNPYNPDGAQIAADEAADMRRCREMEDGE